MAGEQWARRLCLLLGLATGLVGALWCGGLVVGHLVNLPPAHPEVSGQVVEPAPTGWLLPTGALEPDLDEFELKSTGSDEQAASSKSFKQPKRQARATRQVRPRHRRLAPDQRPILNEFSFPANLVQGMRFVLMCQVLADGAGGSAPTSGEPAVGSGLQIRWFKDKRELSWPGEPGSELELIAPQADELAAASSSLLFRRVQPDHNGNYTCLATNRLGLSAAYSSSLFVKVPPRWKIEPNEREASLGQQISIDCQASGNPNPFIRWKFTALPYSGVTSTPATTANNAGRTTELALRALQQSSTKDGQPAPHQFKLINSNHQVQTLENGSLAFRSVQRDHEGVYLCEADNGLEPALVKAIRLLVHQPATITDDLRLVTGLGADQPAANEPSLLVAGHLDHDKLVAVPVRAIRLHAANKTGGQVRLVCEPLGELPMQIDWLKDGQLVQAHSVSDDQIRESPSGLSGAPTLASGPQQVDTGGRYHVNTRRRSGATGQVESELLVAAARRSDAGLYSCLARNQFGEAERKMRLVLQEAPEAPELVDVAHISSRSIGLRWLSPFDGNSPILRYAVEYRRQQDGPNYAADAEPNYSEKLMLAGSTTSGLASGPHLADQVQQQVQHTVHELEPLTRYSMRVVAVNALGRSRPSVALSLRTEEEVPSVVPGGVEALVLSSHSVRLNWTITYSAEHEIIDGFFIGYRTLEVGPTPGAGQPGVNQPVGVEPLPAAPTSSKQPQVSRAAGQMTFTYKTIRLGSSQADQTLDGRPTKSQPPTSLGRISGDALDSSANGPAYLAPKSSVTKQTMLAGHRQPVLAVTSTFEYLIHGLERNADYTLMIQCFNRKGAGPASDPVLFRTFSSDPPERLLLNADETSESSIRVSWRFVGQSGLLASPLLASSRRIETPVDGFLLAFARLASLSLVGPQHGPSPSIESSSSGSNLTSSSFELANPNPAARVIDQPSAGKSSPLDLWQSIQLAPQQRVHLLKGLECGTAYVMKIWAFNKVGKGEPSEPLTVSTRGKAPVAPDRHSFITVNSSQVRLNLGAWYDGGCEIDKFVVQYRARGQQEWNLVSNNIKREQSSVLVRDLLPANSYELLVAAQNQVGTTELKYRFTTLDSSGRQVSNSSPLFPFLGSFSPNSADDEDDSTSGSSADYTDGTRREMWPSSTQMSAAGQGSSKPLLAFRTLLGSPLALVISLSLFLAILLVLVFYRTLQERQSGSSNGTLTHKSSGNGSPSTASICAPTFTGRPDLNNISSGMLDTDPHTQSLVSGLGPRSLSDSPQVTLAGGHHYDCRQFQTYCTERTHNHQTENSSRANVEFGPSSQDLGAIDFYSSQHPQTAVSANQYSNGSAGHYASVQRNGSHLDQIGRNQMESNDTASQDQCLMQMLLMGNTSQQASGGGGNAGDEPGAADQSSSTYAATVAALATLARGAKTGFRLTTNNPEPGSTVNGYSPVTYSSGTLTNGGQRQYHVALSDYHQRSG